MMNRRWLKAYLALALLASPAFSQSQNKTILWDERPQGSDPRENAQPPLKLLTQIDTIEVEDVLVEGVPIKIGEPFTAGVDWLRNIVFRVRNLSNEPLGFVQITLTLPQLKHQLQIPFVACKAGTQACLKPSEELQLRMPGGGLYDWVKKTASDQGQEITTINQAQIKYVMVVLPNGTQLSSGCVKTADSLHSCPHR